MAGVSPLLPPGWQRSCRGLPHGFTSLGGPAVSGEDGFSVLQVTKKSLKLLSDLSVSAALPSDKTHDTRCQ